MVGPITRSGPNCSAHITLGRLKWAYTDSAAYTVGPHISCSVEAHDVNLHCMTTWESHLWQPLQLTKPQMGSVYILNLTWSRKGCPIYVNDLSGWCTDTRVHWNFRAREITCKLLLWVKTDRIYLRPRWIQHNPEDTELQDQIVQPNPSLRPRKGVFKFGPCRNLYVIIPCVHVYKQTHNYRSCQRKIKSKQGFSQSLSSRLSWGCVFLGLGRSWFWLTRWSWLILVLESKSWG